MSGFTFRGTHSSDFGIHTVYQSRTILPPRREGKIAIPGRSGYYDGVAGGVGFTSITVAWLSQLNAFAMVGISGLLAVLSKGAETLQTRMAVPTSISDIITGILLFCMLGCEFFINYKLIFRGAGRKEARHE